MELLPCSAFLFLFVSKKIIFSDFIEFFFHAQKFFRKGIKILLYSKKKSMIFYRSTAHHTAQKQNTPTRTISPATATG
jgi:hypothetical protein